MIDFLRHFHLLLVVLLGTTLVSGTLQAQQDVEIDAFVKPHVVGPGQTLRYELNVSVDGNYDIQLRQNPDFGDFTVLGTSSAPSFVVRNGRASRSLRIQYQLRAPAQTGSFEIGSPTLSIGTRTLTTDPHEVRVIENAPSPDAASPTSDRDNDYGFVEVSIDPDDRTPFVGEQITLRYDLYTNQRHPRLRMRQPGEPALDDFWIEDLSDNISLRRHSTRRNGQHWAVTPLRLIAAFPLRPGLTTIDSLDVTLFDASLFMAGQDETIESDPLSLEIRPLPEGAPENFHEANIGDWNLEVDVDSTSGRVGGQLLLTARIHGTGRPATLRAPTLDLSDDLRLLNTEDDSHQMIRDRRIAGERVIRYHLMPLREGLIELPALRFSYFDPQREEYITLHSDPISIDVEPGDLPDIATKENSDLMDSNSSEERSNDLPSLHAPLAPQALLTAATPTRSLPLWVFWLPTLGLLLLLVQRPVTSKFQRWRDPTRKRRALQRELQNMLAGNEEPPGPDILLKALRVTLNQ